MVLCFLEDGRILAACERVCKGLYSIVEPSLWEHFSLMAWRYARPELFNHDWRKVFAFQDRAFNHRADRLAIQGELSLALVRPS
jgi:hypothetical protein